MDTSKEYINMCGQAQELQERWKPSEGDFVFHKLDGNVVTLPALPELAKVVVVTSCTWLPRLDQLVDLVREHYINISTIQQSAIRVLCSLFDCEHNISLLHSIQTPEQYILSELYQEKYSKWWNGEDWK